MTVALRKDPALKALFTLLLLQGGGNRSWHAALRDVKAISGIGLDARQHRSLVLVNYTLRHVELLRPVYVHRWRGRVGRAIEELYENTACAGVETPRRACCSAWTRPGEHRRPPIVLGDVLRCGSSTVELGSHAPITAR